jgi:hypothetical protein
VGVYVNKYKDNADLLVVNSPHELPETSGTLDDFNIQFEFDKDRNCMLVYFKDLEYLGEL